MKSMTRTIVAVAMVAVLAGGGSAAAGHLIRNHDIAKNTISLNRLTPGVRALIAHTATGRPGPAGTEGTSGAPGAAGTIGQVGAPGANGPTGPGGTPGVAGQDGKDAVTTVTDFGGVFEKFRSNGCDPASEKGDVTIGQHVEFGPLTNGNMSASIYTGAYNGMTLKQVSDVAYDAVYTQTGADQHGGTPYLRFFLNDDNNDVVYSPNTQGRTVNSGEWHHEHVTAGLLRYDDDAGDGSGPYGVNGASFNEVQADHGDDVISGVYISNGCQGAYSDQVVGEVDNLQLTVAGKATTYEFGTD